MLGVIRRLSWVAQGVLIRQFQAVLIAPALGVATLTSKARALGLEDVRDPLEGPDRARLEAEIPVHVPIWRCTSVTVVWALPRVKYIVKTLALTTPLSPRP